MIQSLIAISLFWRSQYVAKIKSAYRACIVGNLRIREKQMCVKAWREERENERNQGCGRETSGISVLFFPDTFPRYNPVASFLVHLSSRCTPHPASTMFYLAGTYIFRPAEIRRLSGRKCLERTSESGEEEDRNRERERERDHRQRKEKGMQEGMRPKG